LVTPVGSLIVCSTVVARAKEPGRVLLFALGSRTARLVTHLDVSRGECRRATDMLVDVVET
jgi:hypothetical protein